MEFRPSRGLDSWLSKARSSRLFCVASSIGRRVHNGYCLFLVVSFGGASARSDPIRKADEVNQFYVWRSQRAAIGPLGNTAFTFFGED
jgi:hypothetical protein